GGESGRLARGRPVVPESAGRSGRATTLAGRGRGHSPGESATGGRVALLPEPTGGGDRRGDGEDDLSRRGIVEARPATAPRTPARPGVTRMPDPANRDARIDAAIDEYLRAADAGTPPDRDTFLAKNPDLAASLAEFLDDHLRMRDAVRPVSESATITANPDRN